MLRERLTATEQPVHAESVVAPAKRSVFVSIVVFFGAILGSESIHAATINGTVFEDVNYGGGAGRANGTSGTVPIPNARVELYRVSSGTLVATATTNASGQYSVSTTGTATQQASNHIVRIVNGTVRSTRTGGAACTTCVPIQTYRTDATGGSAVAVTNRIGGENPALSDSAQSDMTTSGTQTPQSITTVDPATSTSTINGVDFGFNFDTVVNTRDASSCTASGSGSTFFPCQGNLRQFVINSNALSGEGSLAQSGSGQLDGITTLLPSGNESSIFMIPSAQLTSGVAIVTLSTTLTSITGTATRLDATTQTVNIGNTNAGTLGTGGTVGVDAIALPLFQRPEVQISAGNTLITLSGSNEGIVGFALRQGFILLSGSGGLARNNLVGMTASGDSSDNSNAFYGISFTGTSSTVRNNFVTVNNSGIRTDNGGANSTVHFNEVARPTSGHTNTFDGILLVGTVSGTLITSNLTRDQRGGGIEVGFGSGASATNITATNNTVRNNGFDGVGSGAASTEPIGMAAYDYAGSNVVFSRNIIRDNAGPGVMVMLANGTQITQNHFSSNGGLSIDLDTRAIDPNGLGSPQGVTLNDSGDVDTGPNGLRNYAVITSAVLIGTDLTLTGYARPGSAIELYIALADPTGFGEGQTYLGTLTEGSVADLDATTGTYGPGTINGVAQGTDTTNRFSYRIAVPPGVAVGTRLSSTATISGETSEFGGNVVVTGGPSLLHVKSVQVLSDPVNGTTNPKSIPGSVQIYTLRVTNQGSGALDNNSVVITDAIATTTKLFVGNVSGPGTGPIAFTNGSPSSGLSWTFTALNSTTDDVDFSNDGGVTWNYAPTADADGCDTAVTHIRLRPKGTMPGNAGGDPYFELRFRVRVE